MTDPSAPPAPNQTGLHPDTGAPLRSGWTTGACATAATRAAVCALFGGGFPDPVQILLPKGQQPSFPLALQESGTDANGPWARAGIVKDAGDDPDVTHGATVIATVRPGPEGSGITFRAGPGVGTVTKPGLPLPVGEPAINPVPRQLMTAEVIEMDRRFHPPSASAPDQVPDVIIEISIPGGERLAEKTWNPRLGILGGLSVLGTTGVVVPYSCSAWIHSIQRGIDVARATGLTHVAGCTGNTSEKAARTLRGLPEESIIDMGDFVGGMLKYLRQHPVQRVTIAGGFAKLSKLACGHLDLHSKRSQVDRGWLAERLHDLGAPADVTDHARQANTALEILELAQAHALPLGGAVARAAAQVARGVVAPADVQVDVLVFDRKGQLVGDSEQSL